VLFLALLGGFPLDAVRNGDSLLDRLASLYFSLDVLAERGFTCRFDQRHFSVSYPLALASSSPLCERPVQASALAF
jgi:hypothetical protein